MDESLLDAETDDTIIKMASAILGSHMMKLEAH